MTGPLDVSDAAPFPPRLRQELGAGLSEASRLNPGAGFLLAEAGVSALDGPFARVEIDAKPFESLALGAFAQWDRIEPMAGVFARLNF